MSENKDDDYSQKYDEDLDYEVWKDSPYRDIEAKTEDDLEHVMTLIEKRAPVDLRMKFGMTPLMLASELGNERAVRELIARGAFLDHRSHGYTALHLASLKGHFPIVLDLIEAGAALDLRDWNGQTALMYASQYNDKNHFNIAHALIENKASLDIRDHAQTTALIHAVVTNNEDVVSLLVDSKADLDAQDGDGFSALLLLTDAPDLDKTGLNIVKKLIKGNANVNLETTNGTTALWFAASNGFTKVVDYLIKARAHVDAQNNDEDSPLMAAARYPALSENDKTIELLIKAKADVDLQDIDGKTSLMMADPSNVQTLIEHKASLDIQDRDGNTALMDAVINYDDHDYTDAVRIETLVQAKSSLEIKNMDGKTAKDLCYGDRSCLELLHDRQDGEEKEREGTMSKMVKDLLKVKPYDPSVKLEKRSREMRGGEKERGEQKHVEVATMFYQREEDIPKLERVPPSEMGTISFGEIKEGYPSVDVSKFSFDPSKMKTVFFNKNKKAQVPYFILSGQQLFKPNFEKIFGKGSYGAVFLYTSEDGEKSVAVKVFFDDKDDAEFNLVKDIQKISECEVISAHAIDNKGVKIIVLQPMQGTLKEAFPRVREDFSRNAKIDLVIQLTTSLDCLIRKGYCYTDLKPENILINGTDVRLGDLGSIHNFKGSYSFTHKYTPSSTTQYQIPEFCSEVNIFALLVILAKCFVSVDSGHVRERQGDKRKKALDPLKNMDREMFIFVARWLDTIEEMIDSSQVSRGLLDRFKSELMKLKT